MKVRRTAWHYKLYRYWRNLLDETYGPCLPFRGPRRDFVPKSLCSYFWTTLALTILCPTVSLAFGVAFVLIGPFAWVAMKAYNRHERRVAAGEAPNLAIAFVKSKKQRVCPLIELTD